MIKTNSIKLTQQEVQQILNESWKKYQEHVKINPIPQNIDDKVLYNANIFENFHDTITKNKLKKLKKKEVII